MGDFDTRTLVGGVIGGVVVLLGSSILMNIPWINQRHDEKFNTNAQSSERTISDKNSLTFLESKNFKPLSELKLPFCLGKKIYVANQNLSIIYSSGMLGVTPLTFVLDAQTIEEQTKQVLDNLKILLEDNGMGIENIVKARVYLTTMDDFAKMNAVYSQFFNMNGTPGVFPARVCVAMTALPMNDNISKEHIIAGAIGGVVTIALHALVMKCCPCLFGLKNTSCCGASTSGSLILNKPKIYAMTSDQLPPAIGPYSYGKIIECCGARLAYTSGQLGVDADSGDLVGMDIELQADQALTHLKNLAEDNGFSLSDVVKNNLFILDMKDFVRANDAYKRFFPSEFPARTTVAVKELPKGARFEIESVFFKAN